MKEIEFDTIVGSDLVPNTHYFSGNTGNFTRDSPISKLFKFNGYRGIGNMSGIRRSMQQYRPGALNEKEEAFVVLVDKGDQEDWPNVYNSIDGVLKYHGDNDSPGTHHLATKQKGNSTFQKFFHRAYNDLNSQIVPFFYFQRKQDGSVVYIGIAVPYVAEMIEDNALVLNTFSKSNTDLLFENFIGHFTVLEVTASREWLLDLKRGISDSIHAPNAWLRFLLNRDVSARIELPVNRNKHLNNNLESVGYRMAAYRRTQSKFRQDLLSRRNYCDLCGMNIEPLLVASHIVPWSVSDNYQRQDPDNGLLLCITHDALFDKGFISFQNNGEILISETLPVHEQTRMGISNGMSLSYMPRNMKYLELHQSIVFKSK